MTENPPTGVIISPDLDVSPSHHPARYRPRRQRPRRAPSTSPKSKPPPSGRARPTPASTSPASPRTRRRTSSPKPAAKPKTCSAQARTELSEQANAQQQRLASGLHALGDELHSMTQHSDQPGVATDLARQGAGKSHDIASWLEDREPGQLVAELQSFARQRPGTFLLAAAGAGLLAGRLTRGVKDASSDDSDASSGARQPPRRANTDPCRAAPDQVDLVSGSEPTGPGRSGGAGL